MSNKYFLESDNFTRPEDWLVEKKTSCFRNFLFV